MRMTKPKMAALVAIPLAAVLAGGGVAVASALDAPAGTQVEQTVHGTHTPDPTTATTTAVQDRDQTRDRVHDQTCDPTCDQTRDQVRDQLRDGSCDQSGGGGVGQTHHVEAGYDD